MATGELLYMSKILIIIILTLLFTACKEFTGYDYEAESIGDKSHISGSVVNTFSPDEPVVNARVQIGYLTTYTDSSGRFDVEYILSTDDNRNKPIELLVSAPDFLDLISEFIIEIPEQKINLNLDYGAPEIEKIWIGASECNVAHQVIITDYQGIDNIQSVRTVFYYVNMLDPEVKTIPVEMSYSGQVPGSDVSAYYLAKSVFTVEQFWNYSDRWINFTVVDKDGFGDMMTKKYSDIMSSDPLFPISFDPCD
jgi:hypothetical protein